MLLKAMELEDAQQLLLRIVGEGFIEEMDFENSVGKVLGKDIYASIDIPNFCKSPLDGFALRACDTQGASLNNPKIINIFDSVQAGDTREFLSVTSNKGVKIMTGAPLPTEADLVIKKEDLNFEDGKITITREYKSNQNVIKKGSDIVLGDLVISKGEILTPYHIGVLAALGLTSLPVYSVPKVAVISTGDELKYPGEPLKIGQIYNSNLYSLVALVNSLGGKAIGLGNVVDQEDKIREEISRALTTYDIILTTGGASVGDYDLIYQVLSKMGAKIFFTRLAIKPGSAIVAAVINNKIVLGLSGNPAAALISFELLVRPLLKKLRGNKNCFFKILDVELQDEFSKKSPQRRFLRVKVSYENGKWLAKQTGIQDSSILRSMLGCNALVDIPAGSDFIKKGSIVKALLLEEDLLCYHQ